MKEVRLNRPRRIPQQASIAKLCWLLYTHEACYYNWYLFIPCESGYVVWRGERDDVEEATSALSAAPVK